MTAAGGITAKARHPVPAESEAGLATDRPDRGVEPAPLLIAVALKA